MNTDKQTAKAKSLPVERKEEWIMERRAVDVQIEELGVDVKPHLLICMSPDVGIVDTSLVPPDMPDAEALSWALGCMLSPKAGKPRRPKSILLSGGGLEALLPALTQIGVQVRAQSESDPLIDAAVSMMEEALSGEGLPPYLIETDLEPEMVADFFLAAAEFYKLKPWKFFEFELPMKAVLRLKRPKTYWPVVMGVGEQHFGLNLLLSAEAMEALFGAESMDEAESASRQMKVFGFSFENVSEIGTAAEMEYQAYEWVVAAKSAYPSVIVFDPSSKEGPREPNKKELEDLIALTRAVTEFCRAHRKQIEESSDEVEFVEHTFTVPVMGRQVEVLVEFPAPELLEEELGEE